MALNIKWVWISTPKWTVRIELDSDGVIIKTAPIVYWMRHRFWEDIKVQLSTQDGVRVEEFYE